MVYRDMRKEETMMVYGGRAVPDPMGIVAGWMKREMPRRWSAVPGSIPGGAVGGDTMSDNKYASGYKKVVLGSGEPGTRGWNAGTVVAVHETTLEYVRKRMGKQEVDREVMSEAAKWMLEMDQILAEVEQMEMEEEMEDFLQLLPEEVC